MALRLQMALRRLEGLSDVSEEELAELSWSMRQRVFATLLDQCGLPDTTHMSRERARERRAQILSSEPPETIQVRDAAFARFLSKIIVRDLGVVGYTSISAAVLRSLTKRNEVYAAMHFVASVVTRRDRPTRRPSSSELREREARWQGVGVDVRVPSEADLRMETRLNEQQQHTRNAQRRRRAPTVAELRARERNWQPVVAVQEDNEEKMVEPERERKRGEEEVVEEEEEEEEATGVRLIAQQEQREDMPSSSSFSSLTARREERLRRSLTRSMKTDKKRSNVEELRDIVERLTTTREGEIDVRRVHVLKCQLVQMERRVAVQARALETRRRAMGELENVSGALEQELERLREDGVRQVGALESLVGRLRGTLRSAGDALDAHDCIVDDFVAFSNPYRGEKAAEGATTLLDVCSGRIEHLNLRHVSRLEGSLRDLYGRLEALTQSLAVQFGREELEEEEEEERKNEEKESGLRSLGRQLRDTRRRVRECAHELLSLAVLVPAAPTPSLANTTLPDGTRLPSLDQLLARLPPFAPRHRDTISHVLGALLRATEHVCASLRARTDHAFQAQVQAQTAPPLLQVHAHTRTLDCCAQFVLEHHTCTHARLRDALAAPLRSFRALQHDTNERSLRAFLADFKRHADALESLVDTDMDTHSAAEAQVLQLRRFVRDSLK